MEHNNNQDKNEQNQQKQQSTSGQYGLNNNYGPDYEKEGKAHLRYGYHTPASHHYGGMHSGHHQHQRQQHYQQGIPQSTGQYMPGQQQYGQPGTDHRHHLEHQGQHYQSGQVNNPQYQTIKNPASEATPQVKGPEMNDKDFINDILASEKYLTDGLNVFTREASHRDLYQDIKQILMETHDCERDLFNLMFKNGFYSFQAAGQQEIIKTRDQFARYLNSQDPYGQSRGW